MERVDDPSTDAVLSSALQRTPVVILKARDADVLLDAALSVKNTMPVEWIPEVSPLRYELRRGLWVVTIRARRGLA